MLQGTNKQKVFSGKASPSERHPVLLTVSLTLLQVALTYFNKAHLSMFWCYISVVQIPHTVLQLEVQRHF